MNNFRKNKRFLCRTVTILQECERLLSYGGVGTEQYVDFGKTCIPRMLIRALIISVLLISFTGNWIVLYKHYPHDVRTLLFQLHLMLINGLKWSVYSVLLWKTDQIAELIDYLRTVVRRRKFSLTFLLCRHSHSEKGKNVFVCCCHSFSR